MESKCPYKNKEICLVKSFSGTHWRWKFATGKIDEHGNPTFYSAPKSDKARSWAFHMATKGQTLVRTLNQNL